MMTNLIQTSRSVRRARNTLTLALTFLVGVTASAIAQEGDAEKVTFDDHIKPILRQRCAACHGPDKKSGGVDLTNYTALMLGGGSGAAVEPGDADGSYLYMLVTHEEEPVMPPGGTKIPDAELELIRKWIDGGALENQSSKSRVKKKSFDMAIAGNAMERPAEIALPPHLPLEPVLHTEKPACTTAMATSPWAPIVAVAAPKQILLYNTQSLELIGILEFPEGIANVLKFSRDGRLLLAGGGQDAVSGKVVVWDVATGSRQMEVGDELDTVLAADISGDLRWIALGGPKRVVRVYATADGSLAYECTKHTDWITSLAFSPDGILLATGDRAGNVLVWEAPTGNEYLALRGHTDRINDIAWRIDSNLMVTASEDSSIRLWEMENGNQVKNFAGHGGGSTSIEFTREGNLVSNGRDRIAKIWNQNGDLQKQLPPLPDIGTTVAYCHESARLIAGDWSGKIVVGNAADAAVVGELSMNPPPLPERLASAQTQLQSVTAEHEPVAAELAQATQQMTQLQTQMAEMNAARDAKTAELAAMDQQLADAKVTLEGKTNEKTQLQAELDQKTQLLPSLTEVSEKAAAVAAQSPADAELASAATTLAAKVTSTKTRVDELTNLVAEAATQTSLMEQQLVDLTGQRAAKQAEMDELAKQIAAVETQIPPLQQLMTEKSTLVTQLQEQITAAQGLVNRWQSEISFVSELSSLEAKMIDAEQLIDEKSAARDALEKQLAELQAQVDAARAAELEATQALTKLIDEKNALQGISQQ